MRRLACLFLVATVASSAWAQVDPALFEGLNYRLVGPFRGGRSVACTGVLGRPNEFYFGATGGGLWKSTNAGKNWQPVTDGFLGSSSVGAVAVSPSQPDTLYLGTGERDIRGNISEGDGVYRSDDAGKTWRRTGLNQPGTIGRLVVHPQNPEIVWAAVLGRVYVKRDLATGKIDADPNRGIYKSTDGGKTWRKTLSNGPLAGGVHLVLAPNNPNRVYAALWEAWRTPYTMNSGGPGSGLYRSDDGGETWTNLSKKPGLPTGLLGKIGITVSPVQPRRVWAQVEAESGGLFRSDDGGDTWTLMNDNRNWRQRAWYYTHVLADPKNVDTVYALNVGMGRSTDGGKTFQGIRTPHADHHDLWVDPNDPQRMVVSNDGGGSVSVDGGRTWTEQNFPTAQMYHVSTDNAFPYRLLGAQQDNSTVRIPSRTEGSGITEDDWTPTAGGESGYVTAKPNDPDIVFGGSYGGLLTRQNHRTKQERDITAWPDNPMGAGAKDLVHRFQWTFPIVFSPHDPNRLYVSSQHILVSTNLGQSWKTLSPDLTRNDPRTLGPSGGPITKDNTSVEYYGTVFTLAESPVAPGVIWAGSDDGLVHVSLDNGVTWRNVTPPDLPEWGLCSMIDASPTSAGTAYLAVDNHENDDRRPYIFVTRDFGRTWRKLVNGLPENAFVRVVRQDPVDASLLFAGTEIGMFVSFDAGQKWQPLQQNLPLSPIHNLQIKEDDLVVATHGRSFWIMDDLTPLREVARMKTSEARLFRPRPSLRLQWGGNAPGAGANPPNGIGASLYVPAGMKGTLELRDPEGRVTATREVSRAGFQRHFLFPTYPSFRLPTGFVFWAAGGRPIPGAPGRYEFVLTLGDQVQRQYVDYVRDPRLDASDADLIAQRDFAMKVAARVKEANDAVLRIRELKPKAKGKVLEQLTAIEDAIHQGKIQSGQDPLNYPIRLNNKLAALFGVVLGGDGAPTDASYEVFARLSSQLQVQLDALEKIIKDNPTFTKK